MKFDTFIQRVEILDEPTSSSTRDKYINLFVDTASDWYIKNIGQTRQYKDGTYYTGYLWECLLNYTSVTEEDLQNELSTIEGRVFVLWDLHSSEKILADNYWRFPKSAVISLLPRDLLDGLQYLPEDIYIFTEVFDRSLIFTHEYTDDQKRLCMLARANK